MNKKVLTQQPTLESVKHATKQLLRTLLVTAQSLEPLPNDCVVSMKLTYHRDVPEGYQPKNFFAPMPGQDPFVFEDSTVRLTLGEVETVRVPMALTGCQPPVSSLVSSEPLTICALLRCNRSTTA